MSMDYELTPADVCRHWPFVERMINFHRWESGRRALGLVCRLQHEARGEFVELGPKRLQGELGMKPGESGGIWRALVDLEKRNVVTRRRGAGRLPDSWGIRPDVSRWRPMPWKAGGLKVGRSIASCRFCSSNFAVAPQNPGQRRALFLITAEINIGAEDHLPGWGQISRSYGDLRAANASSPAWDPVDSRSNGAIPGAPTVPSKDLEDLLSRTEGGEERHALLRSKVNYKAKAAGEYVFPGKLPDQKLMRLAIRLTDTQARSVASHFDSAVLKCRVPSGVERMEQMAEEELKLAARRAREA